MDVTKFVGLVFRYLIQLNSRKVRFIQTIIEMILLIHLLKIANYLSKTQRSGGIVNGAKRSWTVQLVNL